jgi:hypothetical protein
MIQRSVKRFPISPDIFVLSVADIVHSIFDVFSSIPRLLQASLSDRSLRQVRRTCPSSGSEGSGSGQRGQARSGNHRSGCIEVPGFAAAILPENSQRPLLSEPDIPSAPAFSYVQKPAASSALSFTRLETCRASGAARRFALIPEPAAIALLNSV